MHMLHVYRSVIFLCTSAHIIIFSPQNKSIRENMLETFLERRKLIQSLIENGKLFSVNLAAKYLMEKNISQKIILEASNNYWATELLKTKYQFGF